MLLISWGMSSLSAPVTMTADILSILLVLWIVNKEINPSYKLAWTILILVLPVFGIVVYLLFGESRVAKKMTEESDAVVQEIENYFRENDKVREKIEALDEGISNQSAYIRDYAKFPLHSHTSTRYYPLGEAMFLDMLEDLKKAKHFIFLEYFIIHEGKMWNSILEILEQKVKIRQYNSIKLGISSFIILHTSGQNQFPDCTVLPSVLCMSHLNNIIHALHAA